MHYVRPVVELFRRRYCIQTSSGDRFEGNTAAGLALELFQMRHCSQTSTGTVSNAAVGHIVETGWSACGHSRPR